MNSNSPKSTVSKGNHWRRRAHRVVAFVRHSANELVTRARPILRRGGTWALGNRSAASVIGILVVTVAILLCKREKDPFSKYPTPDQYAAATQASASAPSTSTAPAQSTESPASPTNASTISLHDPDAPGASTEDQSPAKLTPDEVRRLIIELDVFANLLRAYKRDGLEYDAIHSIIATPLVRDALYSRIRTGMGFKYPDLSVRWSEFADADRSDFWNEQLASYCADRIDRITDNIVAKRSRHGDVNFVASMSGHFSKQFKTLITWVNSGRRLERWLANDGIIDAKSIPEGYQDDLPSVEKFLVQLHDEAVERSIPPTPPSPLTAEQLRTMVADIDTLETPVLLKGEVHLRKTPEIFAPGKEIIVKPALSPLSQLPDAQARYTYRKNAFEDLLPFIQNAVSQGTLKDPKLAADVEALVRHRVLPAAAPWPRGLKPPEEPYGSNSTPDHLDRHIAKTSFALSYLRDRAFRGVADSHDASVFFAIVEWRRKTLAAFEDEQVKMDNLLQAVLKSANKTLMNSVAVNRHGLAPFSRDPLRYWEDLKECPCPPRDRTDTTDYPDFGWRWN